MNYPLFLIGLTILISLPNSLKSQTALTQYSYNPSDTTLANEYFAKAEKLRKEAQYDSSNFYYEKASVIYKNVGSERDDPKLWEKYVQCYNNIGKNLGLYQGKYENAMAYLDSALAVGLAKFGENHPDVASSYNYIGIVYTKKGEYYKALKIFEKSLEIRLQVLGKYHPNVASSFLNIGVVYSDMGNNDKAIEFYKKSLAIKIHLFGKNHVAVAGIYNNIGNIYYYKGDYDKALENHNISLIIRLQSLVKNHPNIAKSYGNIGAIYVSKGDYDKALEYFSKSLAIHLQVFDKNHPDIAENYNNMGVAHYRKGNYDIALEYYLKSLAIYLEVGEKHLRVVHGYNNIGQLYLDKGNYGKALEYFNESLSIGYEAFGQNHWEVARTYQFIGEVHAKQNDLDKALYYYQKSILALVPDLSDSNIYVNPPLKNLISETDLLTSLTSKADYFKKLYRLKSNNLKDLEFSLSTYDLASQLIDQIRTGYKAEGSKLILSERAYPVYDEAIQTALLIKEKTRKDIYQQKAFGFAEKSKSGVLLESISDAQALLFSGIPDTLIERERQLKIDLAFYDTQLQQEFGLGSKPAKVLK